MNHTPLTEKQIKAAYRIAIVADVIQLPLSAASATVVLTAPAEIVDFGFDCVVMATLIKQLGFHPILLPSMLGETIPGLELLPTWTGCVAVLVKIRQGEYEKATRASYANAPQNQPPHPQQPPAFPPQLPPFLETAEEARLKKLAALHKQGLISQEEYDAKRQQILAEF